MITFRARPSTSFDWTNISIDGEEEDEIACLIGDALDEADCEVLVAVDGGEFSVREV